MPPKTFVEALLPYSSTDNNQGSDKITLHSYGDFYNSIFEELQNNKSKLRILEIGIRTGATLQALADLLPHAEIHGIDTDLSHLKFEHPRIHAHLMDATDPNIALLGTYDAIIDDASHDPMHQVCTLEILGNCLRPGGVYVIEDIADVNAEWVKHRVKITASMCGLSFEWHDLRKVKGRFDDIVAILRKPL